MQCYSQFDSEIVQCSRLLLWEVYKLVFNIYDVELEVELIRFIFFAAKIVSTTIRFEL